MGDAGKGQETRRRETGARIKEQGKNWWGDGERRGKERWGEGETR